MGGNISQFLADINKRGIAKTSHFDVDFGLPIKLQGGTTPRLLKLRCESAELPGRQIATTDNKIYGPIYKLPYHTMYADMSLTFLETADLNIRQFFETWLISIFDAENNTLGWIDDVVSDITVTQYSLGGTADSLTPTLKFKLIRAFPTNVSQLVVSWADDSPHRLDVTMFYERYVIL